MATAVSTGSGNWSDDIWDGGSGAGGIPADGDAVTIAAGHAVLMNADLSAWTGLLTVTITGGATPGMLYFANGTNGHLKIRTGYNLVGTLDTNRGRLLANSNGTWGGSTALQNSNKAVIDLQGTAKIDARYLDIALYCTQPTNPYVRTYGTAYTCTDQTTDINATTNVITFTGAPPADTTPVRVRSNGTLPTPLSEDYIYYVRDKSGNTCKLALTSGGTAIDITAVGTGTLTMYDGHTNTSTKTLNVIEDVTADAPWTTTAGHNRVVLADIDPAGYDQQRDTLATINAGSLVITTNNVDSAQYPWARIYLSSRNVSIRSNGTTGSQAIVDYTSADFTHSGVFQCEIVNTYQPGTQTTFYGYGVAYGVGHTVSGTICGCNYGLYYGSGHTISGTIAGCSQGIYSGSGHTISGTITGCSSGIYYGSGHTISGTITGCSQGIYYGSGHTISGTICGCGSGIYSGSGHTVSGTIAGCSSGIYYGSGHTISGTIYGCTNGISSGSGYAVSGTITGCTSSFRDAVGFITVSSGADVTYSIYATGVDGQRFRIAVEDYNKTANAHRIYDNCGNIYKTACDGATPGYPDEDPDGGSGYAIEASNLQAIISATNPLYLISDRSPHRIWLAAGAHTITYKVYTTFTGGGGIADNGLTIAATYISDDSPFTRTRLTDSQAIATKTSDTDWTQTLSISIVTAIDGWVDIDIYLTEYESGGAVFVWPTPTVT